MKIIAVCGTLSAKSANLSLLKVAQAVAPSGVEIEIFDGLGRLPLFNPDFETEEQRPPEVERWLRALSTSDAVLIASPEYGHSLTGVLKNAIDWTIGAGSLHEKVVGITAAVPHIERGKMGLQALRQTLNAVNADIIGGSPTVLGVGFERNVEALLRLVVEAATQKNQ